MRKNNTEKIKILFIGDIVGKPGRRTVKEVLAEIKKDELIDLVIANGENLAAGNGMTYEKYQEMINAGIDYFTSGNHIWNNKDIVEHLDDPKVKVLRPTNYPDGSPGKGSAEVAPDIFLINALGRVFMHDDVEDPFSAILNLTTKHKDKVIIVDFHAEATSEKVALGHYLNGKVSAVLGTHTHVQTADEKILSEGTGYITDVGMTGPDDSVLGVKKDIIIEKFLTQLPVSHKVASGDTIFNAVVLTINKKTKKCTKIKRISKIIKSQP